MRGVPRRSSATHQQVEVDEAFELLRHQARTTNQRLAALAESILDGSLDPEQLDGA